MSSERESGLAGVDEHQLPPRHKYRGSDKHVRSTATKASSICVA